MCLIVHRTNESESVSNEWLLDFIDDNPDGVGFMYMLNGVPHAEKALTKPSGFVRMWRRLERKGIEFVVHLRMRTHGNIDMDNCHPYKVLDKRADGASVWMMHNGVLSTGNAGDDSKSDTWHYIQNFIRPLVLRYGYELLHDSAFIELLSGHIGSNNRFVFLTPNGLSFVNKSAGVHWRNMWLSNTYAWSAHKAGLKNYSMGYSVGRYGSTRSLYSYDWEDEYSLPAHRATTKPNVEEPIVFSHVDDLASAFDSEEDSTPTLERVQEIAQDLLDGLYQRGGQFAALADELTLSKIYTVVEQDHETIEWINDCLWEDDPSLLPIDVAVFFSKDVVQ